MSSSTPVLFTATETCVTTITLNRPEKRNALNVELLEALCTALAATDTDVSQRILVLRGAGAVFCSGMDLAEASQADRTQRSSDGIERALRLLASTRLITIAAVQGAAVAGGAGLVSACDFAIATRDAKFGFPEVRRGIVPALIMTFLRRQLRERDARELLLLGKLCDAEHAHRIGLINRVSADEAAVEVELSTILSSLVQGAPETLAQTKRLLTELWPAALDTDFKRAHAIHIAARTSPEAAEGFAAFIEKRPPRWVKP